MILVVDDENLTLMLFGEALEKSGFAVLLASDGESALQLFRERQDSIRLVLADMILPGITGESLFNEIRVINPDMPFIISSGYGAEHIPQGLWDSGLNAFIEKPVRLKKLVKIVSEHCLPA